MANADQNKAAQILERISNDAVQLMLLGEIQADDRMGLTLYAVNRLQDEFPSAESMSHLCPFSLMVGAVLGRSVYAFQVLQET